MTGCSGTTRGLPGEGIHHGLVSDEHDGTIGWIREIVLNSPDPWTLAAFWARLLGGTPTEWYPGWVTLEPPPHGKRLSFQGVSRQAESAAQSRAGPSMHFDVLVSDLPAAHKRVVALGGAFVSEHISPRPGPSEEQVPWRVYQDPAGHPFCLVVR
jgi:Glyoxalase-like domain